MHSALVERIHGSGLRFSIIATGAGASAISTLTSVPGSSRTLLNAQVPYATKATQRILDHHPEKYLSASVGRQLAQHAFVDACSLTNPFDPTATVVGIGATAAVQTDRQRRGSDAVFVSAWMRDVVRDYAVVMSKQASRSEQEEVVASVILKAIADCASLPTPYVFDDVLTVTEHQGVANPISLVLSGQCKFLLYNTHGERRVDYLPYSGESYENENTNYLLYPGSFKPLHWGHTELARVAAEVMQRRSATKSAVVVTYEISASIVGKKDVCEVDFAERIAQFTRSGKRVAITTAKLFVEKAQMFPNHGLVVGVDTVRRVLDPQFYDNSEDKMIEAMQAIERFGCFFVVGGRKHGETWDDLSCVTVPPAVKHLFIAINANDFRVDISSTEIRARRMSTEGLSDLDRGGTPPPPSPPS
jgi:nicotinic acid mononucleotide adenylyltransferase